MLHAATNSKEKLGEDFAKRFWSNFDKFFLESLTLITEPLVAALFSSILTVTIVKPKNMFTNQMQSRLFVD